MKTYLTSSFLVGTVTAMLVGYSGLTAQAGNIIFVPTLVSSANDKSDTSLSGVNIAAMTNNSKLASDVAADSSVDIAKTVTGTASSGNSGNWITTSSKPGNADYFAANASSLPTFIWDVGKDGQDVILTDFLVWVYNVGVNANEVKTISLQFNTTDQGSSSFSGDVDEITLARTTSFPAAPQSFSINTVTARYVKMVVTDNFYGDSTLTSGGDRAGINELRFGGTTATVPEPSSLALGGLGLLGILLGRSIGRISKD